MPTVKVISCYDPADTTLRGELEKHLENMKRQGQITHWHDHNISAGTEWEQEISINLNTADIILLLISPDFMHSDSCQAEMQQALARHEAGEAIVIPIILRYVDWKGAPFSKLQVLPTGDKPITSWLDYDEAFFHITSGIRRIVEELLKERWVEESRYLYQSRKYNEALTAAEEAIKIGPNYAQAFCVKGVILHNMPLSRRTITALKEAYTNALAAFEKAIELDPNYAQAYYEMGIFHKKRRLYNDALTAFEKAIGLDLNYAQAYYEKGILLRDRPTEVSEPDDYDKALAAFEKAIELDSNYAQAYYEKGILLLALSMHDDALAAVEEAIQLNPQEADYHLKKGDMLYELKRYDKALAAYELATQLDPHLSKAYLGMGHTLYELDQLDKALIAYEQVIKLDFYPNEAYRNKGRVYERLAQQAYDKAKELEADLDAEF